MSSKINSKDVWKIKIYKVLSQRSEDRRLHFLEIIKHIDKRIYLKIRNNMLAL